MFKMMSSFWRGISRKIVQVIVEIVLDYLEKKSKEKKDNK